MTTQSGPGAGVVSSAKASIDRNHANPTAPRKWRRVLQRLLDGPLNRFEAEKFPVSDHCLPSTICELENKGVKIHREIVKVAGFGGEPAHVALYTLPADQHDAARRLLERA